MSGWAIQSTQARYAGIFLAAMGSPPPSSPFHPHCSKTNTPVTSTDTPGNYTAMPLMLTWMANNMGGHMNRAVASAAQIAVGNLGGIVSSLAFQAKDGPRYVNGYIICISFLCMTWVLTWVYYLGLKWENSARDAGKRDYLRSLANEEELADRHVCPPLVLC